MRGHGAAVKRLEVQVHALGDDLYLKPPGAISLGRSLSREGFGAGDDAVVCEKSDDEGLVDKYLDEIQEILDSDEEPAEIVQALDGGRMIDPNSFTVSDVERHFKVTRRAADGIVTFFKEVGAVEPAGGERKAEGAKGKGAVLYKAARVRQSLDFLQESFVDYRHVSGAA